VPKIFSAADVTTARIVSTCLLILTFVSLTACYHTHKDGAPNYYVDDTKIPNAVPKVEPISKYGNMAHYKVFGKQYYVMNSSLNYEEQGVASWYGTKFHQHFTSSGERYNMLAMTAAHKTLPLPTYVQVTNLSNGRQIIVKVNDRGPFESNRLIDLSYVAAKKLGMLGHGTTRVDVKAINPRDALMHPEMIALKTPTPHNHYLTQPAKLKLVAVNNSASHKISRYTMTTAAAEKPVKEVGSDSTGVAISPLYIQVGAFRNRNYAEKLKTRLIALISSPVAISPAKNLYRVQVGPFRDIATADRMTKKLKAIGLHNDDFDIT
jgi:rare lipoprotein A